MMTGIVTFFKVLYPWGRPSEADKSCSLRIALINRGSNPRAKTQRLQEQRYLDTHRWNTMPVLPCLNRYYTYRF